MDDLEYVGDKLRGAASDCNVMLKPDQVRYITKAVVAALAAIDLRNKHSVSLAPCQKCTDSMPCEEHRNKHLSPQDNHTLRGICFNCSRPMWSDENHYCTKHPKSGQSFNNTCVAHGPVGFNSGCQTCTDNRTKTSD